MAEELKKQHSKWLTDSILIAIMPVLAYLFAFVSEIGYATYFGIPFEFVAVNQATFFIVGGSLLGLILVWFLIIRLILLLKKSNLLWKASNEKKQMLLLVMRLCWPMPIVLSYLLLDLNYHLPFWSFLLSLWPIIVAILICWGVVALFEFMVISQKHPEKTSFREKLALQESGELGFDIFVIHNIKVDFLIVLFIFWLGTIPYMNSYIQASLQKEFLLFRIAPNNELVVLRIYGDNLICAPFDRIGHNVETKFMNLKTTDIKTMLSLEQIGPLKVKGREILQTKN